jgi:hypothetical protein
VLNKALEEQGYLVDASLMLNSDEEALLFPYHPDPDSWHRPGGMRLLEIPNAGIAGRLLGKVSAELIDFTQRMLLGGHVDSVGQWPILRLCGARTFADYLLVLAERQIQARGCAVLSVYQHPWEFLAMPGILQGLEAKVQLAPHLFMNCGPEALAALGEFIDRMRDLGFVFLTMRDLHGIWERQR